MKKLQSILAQLESYIPDFEKTNSNVSSSTVGWQVDHSLLVINAVISELKKSNPENYKWKFNAIRLYIQITNKIPRGRARVPKSVDPVDVATVNDLKAKIAVAKKNLDEMESLPAKSYFTHPFFGDLKLSSAIWFLQLHTKHHLKIIEDILQ